MDLKKYEEFFGDLTESNIGDWNDFNFVLKQVQQKGLALKFVSNFQDNEEIVKIAVQQDGWALCYASKRLKDNEEIVKEAVKQNGWGLEFASKRLKNNEKIVNEAVKQNGYALQFASCNLQKEFIKKQPELIKYVKQTPELVKLAIDSGLKDNGLIYIPKEEILEYINLAIDSELKDKELIYIPKKYHNCRY